MGDRYEYFLPPAYEHENLSQAETLTSVIAHAERAAEFATAENRKAAMKRWNREDREEVFGDDGGVSLGVYGGEVDCEAGGGVWLAAAGFSDGEEVEEVEKEEEEEDKHPGTRRVKSAGPHKRDHGHDNAFNKNYTHDNMIFAAGRHEVRTYDDFPAAITSFLAVGEVALDNELYVQRYDEFQTHLEKKDELEGPCGVMGVGDWVGIAVGSVFCIVMWVWFGGGFGAKEFATV